MEIETKNKNLAVYHFLETQLEVFKGYFIVTRAIQDEEAIHQMRVAIKRIRSILKLKKHINLPSLLNEEQFNDIKALFAVSGQMRDLHVQQKLLKKFIGELEFEFVDFANYLDELYTDFSQQLEQSLQSFNLKQFDESDDDSSHPAFPENNIDLEQESFSFLHIKLDKIEQLIQAMDKDEFVHDLRKQVKHLFFILHFFSTYFPEREIGSYDIAALKSVGERLGKWNDCEVFKDRVEAFVELQKENYPNLHPEYLRLLEYLDEEKKKYLQTVDADLNQELENIKLLLENGTNVRMQE
jgi:CHAD domain-containing protein